MSIKKGLSLVWKGLGQKGKIATIIGAVFAFPVNCKFLFDFFSGGFFDLFLESQDRAMAYLLAVAAVNGVAMVWFILPSRISIKGGKFEMVVED